MKILGSWRRCHQLTLLGEKIIHLERLLIDDLLELGHFTAKLGDLVHALRHVLTHDLRHSPLVLRENRDDGNHQRRDGDHEGEDVLHF